jgi:hypothetical protein
MYDVRNGTEDLRPRRARRLRRMVAIAVWLMAGGVLVAGCGSSPSGPGVATAGSSSTAARSSSAPSGRAGALAFSRCMRSHGIKDFPDPNSSGELQISAGPGSDLGPGNPQFNAAQQACKSLMPGPGTPAQQHQQLAAALKFARCMRAHGLSGFPDPSPTTGPQTQSQSGGGNNGNGRGTTGIDPNSPQFKAANQACKSLAPGGGGAVVNQSGPGS